MSFYERNKIANEFIKELQIEFWDKEEIKIKYKLFHIPYGYEKHIPPEAQEILKGIYTPTSKYIRFTPDFILLQKNNQKVFLLEYKVIKTPRYSLGDSQWDSGQIEADAWENYIKLVNEGIDVAIVIYCPYHSRPLLCDAVKPHWLIRERTRVKRSTGSGTPYVNINLREISPFENFMQTYFNVPLTLSQKLLSADFFEKLRTNPLLTIAHSSRSPYNNSQYMTGFNWDERYKLYKGLSQCTEETAR